MTFNIPYRESVLYSCVQITALHDMVSFIGSSQIEAPFPTVRDLVARLNARCAVVFFSRVTLPNRMTIYRPLVKSATLPTQALTSTASSQRLIRGQIRSCNACCVVLPSLVKQFTTKPVVTVARCEIINACFMGRSE